MTSPRTMNRRRLLFAQALRPGQSFIDPSPYYLPAALGLLLALLFFLTAGPLCADTLDYEPTNPGAPGKDGRRTPIVTAIEKSRPAVVSISAEVTTVTSGSPFRRSPFHDDFFDNYFSDMWGPRVRKNNSLGSGVIINGAEGVVVTNNHVVRGASAITVTLSDGREMPAELLGAAPRFDLAVLKIKTAAPLPQVAIGDSDQLMIGETVIAIGNPVGLTHSATTGVISATGRTLKSPEETLQGIIQTDAAINPGNSGGPLLNIKGEMIGINTAIVQGSTGLGFAIPSNQVKRVTARLLRGQTDEHPDLGLELAASGRPVPGETGCLIIDVKNGGPGAKAGLKKRDMLMSLDGSPTTTVTDYEMILSSLIPGQSVKAQVNRGGKIITVAITPKGLGEAEALALAWDIYGLKVTERQRHLVLSQPADNSPAHKLGIREGDVLLAVDGRRLAGQSDLAAAILDGRFKTSVNIAVQRGRTTYQATMNR